MSNTYGKRFKITTFGESHGKALGVVVDGCPPGLAFDLDFIQHELDRRRPGQSTLTTQRKESDNIELLSGVFEGLTTGMPIAMVIYNTNAKSQDYEHLKDTYRPSHADYTYEAKYGHRDYRGGGRSSARETLSRVAGGAVAKLLLKHYTDIEILAWVDSVGEIKMPASFTDFDAQAVESNDVRCPHPQTAALMTEKIKAVRKAGDTIGGIIGCHITGVPVGLGEPVFDKLHAELGKAILSINACKGFDYGSGFEGTTMLGSEHNDLFYMHAGHVRTKTNFSGGIQGGISNGESIYFRAAFKPVATLMIPQPGIDKVGNAITIEGRGRHDPCVLPRAVPIVEAMAALVLADFWLRTFIKI